MPGPITGDQLDLETRKLEMRADLDDPKTILERVYQLWWHWADFHLYVVTPSIPIIAPPIIIPPEAIPDSDQREFVYPILDAGHKLSTSKAEDMFSAGKSMCKMYYTIEKMIRLLIDRMQSGGISTEQEVQVGFVGHILAQRKAFESIINLNYNVVVVNFDPGPWGEAYLQIVKRMADLGYGYPPEAPRDVYKQTHTPSTTGIKR